MKPKLQAAESRFGRCYRVLYESVCGRHPDLRPWHSQWLGTRKLYAFLRLQLPVIAGGAERTILDAGFGDKPYQAWFGAVREYVCLDIYPGSAVDFVIGPDDQWPFEDERFDVVFCAQVLEHAADPRHTVSEIRRTLKRDGRVVVSVPFLYNEHGAPLDFTRFTTHGLRRLFAGWEFELVEIQGGIGSTMAILFLNWWDQALTRALSR